MLAAVVVSGVWRPGAVSVLGVALQRRRTSLATRSWFAWLPASWRPRAAATREANEYTWAPIREVAILFAGIFVTIVPVLLVLRAGEHGALAAVVHAVETPAQFFWATGALSSFLDNAPTYLTFLSTAVGRIYPGDAGAATAILTR